MVVAIVYTLAGFLLTPYLFKRQMVDELAERTGGVVTIGQISVNPFLLITELHQLSITRLNQAPLFTLERVRARLDVASLWRRGWVIREVVIDTPFVQADAMRQWYKGSDSVPLFSIAKLQVMRGQLKWSDTSSGASSDTIVDLTDLEFSLEDLGGEPYKPGRFTLAATVNHDGWLSSNGSLGQAPESLDAVVELGDLDLAGFDAIMPVGSDAGEYPKIRSALLSGKFNVILEQGQASIRGQAGLDQLELVARSDDATIFSATNVQATELAIDVTPFRATVEALYLNQPHLRLTFDTDGVLRGGHWLMPLFDRPDHLQPTIPRIEIQDGFLDLTDQGLKTPYRLETDRLEGSILRQDDGTTVSMAGRVMGAGRSMLSAHWLPSASDGHGRLDVSLRNLGAIVLSPYLEAVTGRGIVAGRLDIDVDYQAADQQFELLNDISALGLQLDDELVVTPDIPWLTPKLPLDLAVALLRDSEDRINISIPVPTAEVDGNERLGSLVSEGLMDLVESLTRTPFFTLGKLNGISPPYLERIVFMPGDAALPMPAERNLAILSAALLQRPDIGLTINGRFDTIVDRQALARKQVRLHVALASSAGRPGRATQSAIDFNDSKVISVLDEFAGKRLSVAELGALRASHPNRGSVFYAAVFDALVNNEEVSRTKLKALGRYRAQTIADQLKAAGIDPRRLQIGTEMETASESARRVFVNLEIVLL